MNAVAHGRPVTPADNVVLDLAGAAARRAREEQEAAEREATRAEVAARPPAPVPPPTAEAGRELLAARDWRTRSLALTEGDVPLAAHDDPGPTQFLQRLRIRLELGSVGDAAPLRAWGDAVRGEVVTPLQAAREEFFRGATWATVLRLQADLAAAEKGLREAEAVAPVWAQAITKDLAASRDSTANENLLAKEKAEAERFRGRIVRLTSLLAAARVKAEGELFRALQDARSRLHHEAAAALEEAQAVLAKAVSEVASSYLHAALRHWAAAVDAHREVAALKGLPD